MASLTITNTARAEDEEHVAGDGDAAAAEDNTEDASLEDLVGTLMGQLRAAPPDWLIGLDSQPDDATAAARAIIAAAQEEAEHADGVVGGCAEDGESKSSSLAGDVTAGSKTENKDTNPFQHFSEATEVHWKLVAERNVAAAAAATAAADAAAADAANTATDWYGKAEEWWADPKKAPATVDGVLGGFGELDPIDISESSQFLADIRTLRPEFADKSGGDGGSGNRGTVIETRALDGGAGIGRVAKHLLCKFFDKIDLVEGNRRLLDAAPQYMLALEGEEEDAGGYPGTGGGMRGVERRHRQLGELFCATLQDFDPQAGRYDCIWVQWVVIYLTDEDFVAFLRRCAKGLRPGGLIVIKENVLGDRSPQAFLLDEEDSSLTRSKPYMKHIFKEAGLSVFLEAKQENWQHGMLPVMMYALEPASLAAP